MTRHGQTRYDETEGTISTGKPVGRLMRCFGLFLLPILLSSAALTQARLYVVRTKSGLTHSEFRFASPAPAGFEEIESILLSRIQTAANGKVIERKPEGSIILHGADG